MAYNTVEEIEAAYKCLEDEEKLVQLRLEGYVSKQYHLEAMLKNISKSLPKLKEITVDAEKLASVINQTANLAESVSDKVRRLDLTRCRVSECQQRIHDLLDLQLCSEGVKSALVNEDYEKAASHVQRFLSIDQEVLKKTAADFAEDETSVTNSFSLLKDVTDKLRSVVTKKMNEAIVEEDLASVERFFKIYPLLNLHEEGIAKYTLFLSKKLKDSSKKNLEVALEANKYDQKPNIIFADTLNSLLEGTARIIETCQPLIETYYGANRLVLFIKHLQQTCDSESNRIIQEFVTGRKLKKKIGLVSEYENNLKTVEKLDSKALGLLLAELTNMHAKIEMFFKFLFRRAIAGIEETSEDYEKAKKEIGAIINKSVLSEKKQEILEYYVRLEKFFIDESIKKAIATDVIQEGDFHLTSMVDDVFFIVKKAMKRACSSCSLEGVCALLNNVCCLLETEYCTALKQQLRQGYPPGYMDLAHVKKAYTVLQSGWDPEHAKVTFLAYLNDADLSLEYIETFKGSVREEIEKSFPKLTEREKEKVDMCLAELTRVSKGLSDALNYGIKNMKDSAIKPRVSPWINSFLDRDLELSEEEFNNYDSGETFMQQVIGNVGPFLASFKNSLTKNNYNGLVNVLTTEIAKQFEKVMKKSKYNRLGGLVVDKELRGIIAFLTTYTSWSVREKFARVIHTTMLLNIDKISEVGDIEIGPGVASLDLSEIKSILRRRTDLNIDEIDSLKL